MLIVSLASVNESLKTIDTSVRVLFHESALAGDTFKGLQHDAAKK